MGLISKTINRSNAGTVRKEDDRTKMIDDFFAGQKEVVRYEIADSKEWMVIVEGSIHLHESDLDNGELFFKIGKLTGNLYCHCRHFKPSVVPAELGGEIVFVPDEKELWKNRASLPTDEDEFGGMEMLTTDPPTKSIVIQKIADLLTTSIVNDYQIDIESIKRRLEDEWNNRDKYELIVEFEEKESDYIIKEKYYTCKIFLKDDTKKIPLDLSAVEKAVYLTFMLYEEGILIEDMPYEFVEIARKIYSSMSDKKKAVNIKNGLMSENFFYSKNLSRTMNSNRAKIRRAIEAVISNSKIVDDFAVEGFKNEPVFVKKATPDIRTQIRQTFGLD